MIPVTIKSLKNPKTGKEKYYYTVAPVTPLTLERIAKNISARCTVTETDCLAVLNALEVEVVKSLQDGHSVRLGQLGSFRPTVTSYGADTLEEVRLSNIKAVRARFTMGGRMRSSLLPQSSDVIFEVQNGASGTTPDEGE